MAVSPSQTRLQALHENSQARWFSNQVCTALSYNKDAALVQTKCFVVYLCALLLLFHAYFIFNILRMLLAGPLMVFQWNSSWNRCLHRQFQTKKILFSISQTFDLFIYIFMIFLGGYFDENVWRGGMRLFIILHCFPSEWSGPIFSTYSTFGFLISWINYMRRKFLVLYPGSRDIPGVDDVMRIRANRLVILLGSSLVYSLENFNRSYNQYL